MRTVPLGSTGLSVSEVGFGGIPIIRLDAAEAERVLRRAHERGITLYDTANMYLDSEDKLGRALSGVRDELVLATKTYKRDRAGAAADIEQSLRALRTDRLDLLQLHQVSQEADLQAVLGPDGAMEAVARAVDAGKVRHVGVSSHNLAMAKRLVDSGLFATVQYPFSVVEDAAGLELIPPACARGMAVLAMKPFGGGMIGSAGLAFAYLRQFPEVVPLAGFDSVAGVDEVCDIYDRPSGVGPDEEAAFARLRAELGKRFCRRCEYCQPCPQGVMITPAMLYKVVAHRMSPAKAMNFSAKAMESVRACVQCGECAGRCPYDLPIPDMLAEHLEMYDRHKAECGGAG